MNKIALAIIFLLVFAIDSSAQQCKAKYSGTNTGLACELSSDGKGIITLEDEEGNSKILNTNKAKRTLERERRQLQQLRRFTERDLRRARRLDSNSLVSSSRHQEVFMQSMSIGIGLGVMEQVSEIRPNETIESVTVKFKTMKGNANQAIRKNKKIKKLLRSCKKKRRCDCSTKTTPATMEWYQGNNPEAQQNCQAFGLAKWSAKDTENAKSVKVFITVTPPGQLRSTSGTPPYDDVHPFYNKNIVAGEGFHQLLVAHNSASHGNPAVVNDCSGGLAALQSIVSSPYVEAEICVPVK